MYVTDNKNALSRSFAEDERLTSSWLLRAADIKCSVESIDVDSSGNVYVASHGNNCTEKFTDIGEFIKSWESRGSGTTGLFFLGV